MGEIPTRKTATALQRPDPTASHPSQDPPRSSTPSLSSPRARSGNDARREEETTKALGEHDDDVRRRHRRHTARELLRQRGQPRMGHGRARRLAHDARRRHDLAQIGRVMLDDQSADAAPSLRAMDEFFARTPRRCPMRSRSRWGR